MQLFRKITSDSYQSDLLKVEIRETLKQWEVANQIRKV
jgi:hypothetical protein